jgi:hypothetical protein
MKRECITLTLLLCGITTMSAVTLESPVLKRLDGIWPAFDGRAIFEIGKMARKYRIMCLGEIVDSRTKERVGLYTFQGKRYGLTELARIEQQNQHNEVAHKELSDILEVAKQEFCDINRKFIDQIQRFKPLVIQIMQESCQKRNVPHSFMLRWSNTQPGKEEESFKAKMNSITELEKFFNELINFFSDIVENCPKGMQQYKELIAQIK